MILEIEFDCKDTAIEEAVVSTWFVEEGEIVDQGDALLELVADDESIEIRAPSSGTIVELRVDEDETIKVGDVVCLLDTADVWDYAQDEDEDEDEDDEEEDEPE